MLSNALIHCSEKGKGPEARKRGTIWRQRGLLVHTCRLVSFINIFAATVLVLTAGVAAQQAGPPAAPTPVIPAVVPMSSSQVLSSASGSVPQGTATQQVLSLTLEDAISRGLKTNLAVLLSQSQSEAARGARYLALTGLLPQVQVAAFQNEQKINLAAFGFTFFPGIPLIVGPFRVFDARAFLHQPLNLSGLESVRSTRAGEAAARDSLQDARELVVLAVANQYLLAVADRSRVQAAQARLTTAQQAFERARDMKQSGVVSGLDVVRAQVQRDREQQAVIAAQNEEAKQKLRLARAIGLPPGQQFEATDNVPYAPLTTVNPEQAIAQALATRSDYRAAQETVRAAHFQLASARSERLPSLAFDANYGTIGQSLYSNHPTFLLQGAIEMPVFAGGRIRGQVLQATARLHDAESRAADLRAGIDQEVRAALLDIQAAGAQVQVAQAAQQLADEELTLARDRFRAGVADNLEEIQAEQEVAVSNENYISSLYAYNVAKASLARALGVVESSYRQFLKGEK
jgi:outer membrane protein TolC